jgi:hypothetical protein
MSDSEDSLLDYSSSSTVGADLEKHSEIMLQKIEIKKRKLELYQQRMALKDQC